MQGEYRGDFTRDTFHRANHFCRVLMQQGRVQLDADWNEQTSILLHFLRTLARDMIGQHGGPDAVGFAITPLLNGQKAVDLIIGAGHYYVDGILCEIDPPNASGSNAQTMTYLGQPYLPNLTELPAFTGNALVYLDVWELHITSAQHDLIREVALGGPDTASRAQVVWQVKIAVALPDGILNWPQGAPTDPEWQAWTALWQPANRGLLQAQILPQQMSTDACIISPQSAYRGTENQLYRVEIHGSGLASQIQPGIKAEVAAQAATFKWSRENGSVVFPILKLTTSNNNGNAQTTVMLANLGRDSRLSLEINDWVEVVDDASALSGTVDSLLQVQTIDPVSQMVTLSGTSQIQVDQPPTRHPILRRWDGTGTIVENTWLPLEDGIQIQFQGLAAQDTITVQTAPQGQPAAGTAAQPRATTTAATTTVATQYRSGDYWLIPARVATGTIEWPQQNSGQGKTPVALPPHGVEHHYAPLALLTSATPNSNGQLAVTSLRRTFATQAK